MIKDRNNINIKEESQKPYAKHHMFSMHNKLYNEIDDLHMALKSCNEIASAKTLFQFFIDLNKITKEKIPSRNNVTKIQNDQGF